MAPLKRAVTHRKHGVGVEHLFMLRCGRSPVMLTWLRQLSLQASEPARLTALRFARTILRLKSVWSIFSTRDVWKLPCLRLSSLQAEGVSVSVIRADIN